MIYSAVATTKGISEASIWPESKMSFLDAIVIGTIVEPKTIPTILKHVSDTVGYDITAEALSNKLLSLEAQKLVTAIRELLPETRIKITVYPHSELAAIVITGTFGGTYFPGPAQDKINSGLLHFGIYQSKSLIVELV